MSGRSIKVIVIWGLLAALAFIIYQAEKKRSTEINKPVVVNERRLLPIPIEEIGAIEILDKGTMHRFERDAAGSWFYHGLHNGETVGHDHKADPEMAQIIDKALTGFGRTRREQSLALDAKADEFGVTRPDMFIMVYRPKAADPVARYAVGVVTSDKYARYVLPVGEAKVQTIAEFHITNLLNLIARVNQAAPAVKK